MDEFNRPYIHTSRLLRNQKQSRLDFKLASNDQLLLVTTRKNPRLQRRVSWSDIESSDDLSRARCDRVVVEKDSSVRNNRRPVLNTQDRILSQGELEQQASPMTVLRNVSNSQLPSRTRRHTSY